MRKLKQIIKKYGGRNGIASTQKLADAGGVSKSDISNFANCVRDARLSGDARKKIINYLQSRDLHGDYRLKAADIAGIFDLVDENGERIKPKKKKSRKPQQQPKTAEAPMLTQTNLPVEVCKHFGFYRVRSNDYKPENPFANRLKVSDLFTKSEGFGRAFITVKRAIEDCQLVAVIGQTGTGKSQLKRYIMDHMDQTRRPFLHLSINEKESAKVKVTENQLIRKMIQKCGTRRVPVDRLDRVEMFIDILAERNDHNRPVLIIDNIENMTLNTLLSLRKLHDQVMSENDGNGFSIVFIGMDDFKGTLTASMEAHSRIEVVNMPMLDANPSKTKMAETIGYINDKLGRFMPKRVVGTPPIEQLFEENAVKRILAVTHRAPKFIDNFIACILLTNFSTSEQNGNGKKLHKVTADEVNDAIKRYGIGG